jgi:Alternative complex III, ActD subunit
MDTTKADNTTAPAEPRRLWGLMAEFEDVDHLLDAAEKVRDAGFRRWDCYTPFPVHHLDEAMGQRPTVLPWISLVCGLTGLVSAVILQWWTNASSVDLAPTFLQGYPFLISGKPFFSLPANVPVIFELTILFAALGTVVGMLALNQLPLLYHPLFKRPRFARVTNDRFFIAIEAMDSKFEYDATRGMLESLGAAVVEDVED